MSTETDKVYIVSSFDVGDTSNVKVHVVTSNLELAQETYVFMCVETDESNLIQGDEWKTIVELTELPLDTMLLESDAALLFWGNHSVARNTTQADSGIHTLDDSNTLTQAESSVC